MSHQHYYKIKTVWNGDKDRGTSNVRTYNRSHTVSAEGKPHLHLTTDNDAVGDKSKLNPEDLLVASISSCHMLSYLYVCAMEKIIVLEYFDEATGTMTENEIGGGQFNEVTLHPHVVVAEKNMLEKAMALHHRAHEICYIANSVNFQISIEPVCICKTQE